MRKLAAAGITVVLLSFLSMEYLHADEDCPEEYKRLLCWMEPDPWSIHAGASVPGDGPWSPALKVAFFGLDTDKRFCYFQNLRCDLHCKPLPYTAALCAENDDGTCPDPTTCIRGEGVGIFDGVVVVKYPRGNTEVYEKYPRGKPPTGDE